MPPATSAMVTLALPSLAAGRTPRSAKLKRAALVAFALVIGARSASAQTATAEKSKFEFLMSSGSLVPTGTEPNRIKRGDLSTAQLSYLVLPRVAVTTTIGWARSRDLVAIGAPKLDVFTYDLGTEVRANSWPIGRAVTLTPLAGLGAGARSYNYRSLDVDATHNLAAYGSAGGELGYRRVRLRVEVRDYVSGFKPLVVASAGGRRTDVAVMVGLRLAGR